MRFALLLVVIFASCATPKGEGRLVQRLAPVKPEKWPRPVPIGETSGLDVTQGALSDAEAQRLPLVCMQSVRTRLRDTRDAKAPELRIVLAKLVVDTRKDERGDRMVRVRAVLEMRKEKRPLASANGLAFLTSGAPSFRGDGVEPGEIEKTVKLACTEAIKALAAPSPAISVEKRAQLTRQLHSQDAKDRAAALAVLGETLSEADGETVIAALSDEDASVRRMAAWSLGELCETRAIETLAHMAELDADYAVRFEAVIALNKMIASDRALADRVRLARDAAAHERLRRAMPPGQPAPQQEPEDENAPSRVLTEP